MTATDREKGERKERERERGGGIETERAGETVRLPTEDR